MSDTVELKAFLNKSTVAQLKEQCSQRDLPVTPAKKTDLVNRLCLYLKDHSDDELIKVASNDNNEDEAEEEEEIDEDDAAPMEAKVAEEDDDHVNEEEEKGETDEKANGESEEPQETEEKPEEVKEEEVSMEGIEDTDEIGKESKDKDQETEKKTKDSPEKDNKEEAMDSSDFIVLDDSEVSEQKGDAKEKKEEKPFKRPAPPDSRVLSRYRQIDYRCRTLIVYPVTVEDLALEEVQELLTGDIESLHYNLNYSTAEPKIINGHIHVVFTTWEETAKKLEEFTPFKEGVTVTRLSEDLTKNKVLEDAGLKEKQVRSNNPVQQAAEKRTICAHYVPEGTSEEVLRSHFPKAKSFLWARDENGKYQGMVFMGYEDFETTDEEWSRLRKEKIIIDDTRLWFHTVPSVQGPKNQQSQLLGPENRAKLNTRNQQLQREMKSIMLSPESLMMLKKAQMKIDDTLTLDKREQQRQKEELAQKRREAAKKAEKESVKKTDRKPDEKKESNNEAKATSKHDGGKKAGEQQKKADGPEKKNKRPRSSSEERKQPAKQNRQKPKNRQNKRSQFFSMQQRSPNYSRWQDRSPSAPQRGGILGMPPHSSMAASQPRALNMNQGFGQQNMGMANPRLNPQATANAVSLLVGLSSILGGNLRRQSGDGMSGYGASGMAQGGGYRDDRGEWVGGYNEEPRPKRSRYSATNKVFASKTQPFRKGGPQGGGSSGGQQQKRRGKRAGRVWRQRNKPYSRQGDQRSFEDRERDFHDNYKRDRTTS